MKITTSSITNGRYYQEDRIFVKILDEGILSAIFDGHGGFHTAEFAYKNLFSIFESMYQKKMHGKTLLSKVFSELNKHTCGYNTGSTASIVWIPKRNNTAFVGILGDSPVFIKNKNCDIWASPEHNVRNNKDEAQAASKLGGVIYNGYLFDGNYPSGPGLQMSRALGDVALKNVLNRNPEIFSVPINKKSWILIASDGLLDPAHYIVELEEGQIDGSHSNIDKVVNMIDSNAKASNLTRRAKELKTGDNASAILIRIK